MTGVVASRTSLIAVFLRYEELPKKNIKTTSPSDTVGRVSFSNELERNCKVVTKKTLGIR